MRYGIGGSNLGKRIEIDISRSCIDRRGSVDDRFNGGNCRSRDGIKRLSYLVRRAARRRRGICVGHDESKRKQQEVEQNRERAEQDFLLKLPTKLIIGLGTLFISTTTMIVAFAATLYLVFGQSNSRILIPTVVVTCLPITSFVTLQISCHRVDECYIWS
ncbi:unnamed protein product [Lactuca saligna]|uniref:Transmembrane protein n=1 Tax=Lactuca saligna TaxID=75948 RepID=A0AA36EEI0_LACSI|nr:unnamed protein product [Lactuca saligna]